MSFHGHVETYTYDARICWIASTAGERRAKNVCVPPSRRATATSATAAITIGVHPATRAGRDLVDRQHLAEPDAGRRPYPERDLVIQRVRQVRLLHYDVIPQRVRIAQVLQDGRINLRVLLQPGVSRKLIKGKKRERQAEGG